ncbi:hypothetical protein KZZ52_44655 [Dactylosporangium sp. AC04546]|uniref:hypothetical protein n=1 Tax=Dactylosporangium sp. AC04546 TaxID=2862460 RepID=UPI001EE11E1E|nr:hypothetical protein [Dactylosporangium sp. AC04546]WVK81007.1 hypothetical protein KZZ52_44655 [Dactylosporangium sp. AC04546]
MTHILQMSTDDLTVLYTWPFPPERGAFYDATMMAHWLELQVGPGVVVVPAENAVRAPVPPDVFAESKPVSLSRSQWAALATSATIGGLLARQDVAVRLDPAAAQAVGAANATDLGAFTDGMLGSPPACDVVPASHSTIVVVVGPTIVVIPIPSRPDPDLLSGAEALTRHDLLGVGVRLRAAADAPSAGTLRDAFLSAADRMFEAAIAAP